METQNNQHASVAEFFEPSKATRIWRIILAVIVSLMIIGAAYEFNKPVPDPAQMTHESSSDTHSYLDILLLSNWMYDVSGDEDYTLYAAMDPDENWFIVALDENVAATLQPQMDAYEAYFTDDYMNYNYPDPVRIYGMPTYMGSEDTDAVARFFDMEASEVPGLFGTNYLNEGADNSRSGAFLYLMGVFIFGLFLLVISLQLSTIRRNQKKSNDKLYAQGLLDEAENQFLNDNTLRYDKMKLAVSPDYAYVGSNGYILPLSEIAWLYKRTQRSYGITVATQLMAGLSNGKQIFLVQRHATDECITEVARRVLTKNPNCLIGYSFDLAKQYRQRVKEYKANNPK